MCVCAWESLHISSKDLKAGPGIKSRTFRSQLFYPGMSAEVCVQIGLVLKKEKSLKY